jgi:hypothetical protein
VTVIESIIKNLETLPASKLVEVAHFISGLNPNRRNERIAALKATAGSMPGEEGEAFEKAVREEADRIDADAWKLPTLTSRPSDFESAKASRASSSLSSLLSLLVKRKRIGMN